VIGLLLALLSAPPAHAGGEAALFAEVLLTDAAPLELAALVGPPRSRATWFSLGGIEPRDGGALVAFSTGDLLADPLPGTDLSAVGPDDDIAGLQMTLDVPPGARSLRIAYQLVTAEPSADVATILVQGDPIALDPASLGPLRADATVAAFGAGEPLAGTAWAGGAATGWLEAVVPVAGEGLLAVEFEVRDVGDAFGDVALLVDGVAFDDGVPESVQPGPAPRIDGLQPADVPPEAATTVRLAGRDLPPDLALTLVGPEERALAAGDVRWLSAERMELDLPPLPEGSWGVRADWDGGAITWPDRLVVAGRRPTIEALVPDVADPAGGGLVVLTGTGLYGEPSVRVGGVESPQVRVLSPTRLEFLLPAGEPGPADVIVFTDRGAFEAPDALRYAQLASEAQEPADDAPPRLEPACAAGGRRPALLLLPLTLLRRRDRVRPPCEPGPG
jgi:hypothetical protein